MSIFGALFSGVSGLNANAQAMGTIADNISNVNTVGYKRTETRFATLVTTPPTATFYTPGGVKTAVRSLIDRQGLLTASATNTHMGLVGQGFFLVSDISDPTATTGTFQYTRAGQFEPDEAGNLRNAAGFYLRGWAIDDDGAITTNRSSLTATETVNIANLTGTAAATTDISLQANLQSSQAVTVTGPQDATTAVVASADTNLTAAAPALANGNTITVQSGSGTTSTFTFLAAGTPTGNQFQTLNQLSALINAVDGIAASVTGTTLTVTGDPANTLTIAGTGAANLFGAASTTTPATYTAGELAAGTETPDFERSVQIFDSKGGSHTLTFAYIKSQFANRWYTEAYIEPATETTATNGLLASGMTMFNTDGSIDLTNTSTALTDPITIPWLPDLGIDNQSITIDFGTDGGVDGLTQLDAPSALIDFDVNGAVFGQLTGVTIDDLGVVTANFDNGITRAIYKLPIATFSNANGLEARSGNTFVETDRSGSFVLQEAGVGAAGLVSSASIEASTVDLAEEFTRMIVTQQAFSAASRIITTADELLDEVVRLKR